MLKLYFAPYSRSVGVHWLLQEIGQPYELEMVDIRAKGGVPESYRAIQPNKKVPALEHDGRVVTERAAICLYLTEAFPEAGLAPPVGAANRATFLTWLVYCDSVYDPALAAHAQSIKYLPGNFSFGSFDDMVANLERHLSKHPYAAGDEFTAADTQLASGVYFGLDILKALPDKPVFREYVERCTSRPAYQRTMAREAEAAG